MSEGTTDLVFGCYQDTCAWFVAYLAGFGRRVSDLAVSVDIRERSHLQGVLEEPYPLRCWNAWGDFECALERGECEDVGRSNREQVLLSNKSLKSCEGAPQGCTSRVATLQSHPQKFQRAAKFGNRCLERHWCPVRQWRSINHVLNTSAYC